jgi:hypothetical protein
MRIYLSGPITGYLAGNREAFAEAERELVARGHIAVNPHSIIPGVENPAWRDYMAADITELVRCQGIHFLPGWRKSRGSRIEARIARDLGLEVVT